MRKNNNTNNTNKNGNIYEMVGQIVVATTVRMVAGYAIGAAINKLEKAYKEKKALKNNNADPSELEKAIANCRNFANVHDLEELEEASKKCNIPKEVLQGWQYVEPTDAKDEEDEDLEW